MMGVVVLPLVAIPDQLNRPDEHSGFRVHPLTESSTAATHKPRDHQTWTRTKLLIS